MWLQPSLSRWLPSPVTKSIQLRRITRERDRADRVSEFMTSMFRVSDPSESRGNSITAREILDNGSKSIETSLAKDPELQADLIATMAATYLNLGLYSRAQEHLERAVETISAACWDSTTGRPFNR